MNEFGNHFTTCGTKKRHDTEWEATRVAAIMEHKYSEEFVAYECGNHWHTAHADPDKRRGAGHNHRRCPHCKQIYTNKQMEQHKCPVKEALGYDSPLGF